MNLKLFKIQRKLFPKTVSSQKYVAYLRQRGVEVGKGTIIYDAGSVVLDDTRPCLLKIGEYCKITAGVTVLTHDYSRSVLRRVYGPVLGEGRVTRIGNNVFIGVKSTVLMGTTIGNNVIVGAGSVVSGTIPDNVVIAGNPAKIIRTLDEHYEIWKKKTVRDAFEYVSAFEDKYNRIPTVTEMGQFYQLYLKRDEAELVKYNINISLGGDNREEVLESFLNSEPMFNGYEDFIDAWRKENAKNPDGGCGQ